MTAKKKDKEEDQKPKGQMTLAEVKAQINKEYGDGTIVTAKQSIGARMFRISYGILQLDIDTGGGLPYGKNVLFHGRESCGKTTVALKTVASFQKHCRWCKTPFGSGSRASCLCKKDDPMVALFLDAENKFDSLWAKKNGVDLDILEMMQPTTSEEGMNSVILMMQNKVVDLVIYDSIASTSPSTEFEESMEDWQMGLAARLNNKFLRSLL